MWTVYECAQAVRDRRTTAETLVATALDRVAERDGGLGAFLSVDAERSLDRARAVDARIRRGETPGVLAGVPLAVKDNICTTFGATTCGSGLLASFRSTYDAHVVDRLERAGAVIIGKTNLDEFAMGSTTENSAFHPTRNPWDTDRVPGGSSGGSTAAVAARLVPGALGSSTGGSIRQPASFCGVCGLKPSYGRVSRYGLVAYASSLDQIGPIARDARDVALLLNVIAGHDPRDATSVKAAVPDAVAALDRPLEGLRIGIADEYFGDGLNAEVRDAVQTAVDVMCRGGATRVPVSLPNTPYAIASYYVLATAEASSNLARFDGIRYGARTESAADVLETYARTRGAGFGPEVKRRIVMGTFALSSGYHDAYYQKAARVRTLVREDFDRAFRRVDVLAAPVAPTTAYRLGEKVDDPLAMYLGDVYTISANLAGICAMSMPCGFDGRGLPIGMQLMGPALGEPTVLAAAHRYQQLTDHHARVPPSRAESAERTTP